MIRPVCNPISDCRTAVGAGFAGGFSPPLCKRWLRRRRGEIGAMPEARQSRDGSPFFIAPHPAFAIDAVRYVGEAVAVVIAETLAQAMDAAERVDVSYEVLPAVARSRDALMLGAPLVWEQHGSNLCVDSETGNS